MTGIGKTLILVGLIVALLGVALLLSDKVPWLGRLPGDINIKRGNFTFYFPLVTCIILSIVISLLLHFFRK